MNNLKKCPLVVFVVAAALVVGCVLMVRQLDAAFGRNEQDEDVSSTGDLVEVEQPFHDEEPSDQTVEPEPEPEPEPEGLTFQPVNESYFDDALLIGDSRTVGLKMYGDLPNADYFCNVGLNIYQLFETPKTDEDSGLTLTQTLQRSQYRKIYIMLGINEIGTGSESYFAEHYGAAIQKIQELQPDAIIYIQSILYVTEKKSSVEGTVFNNDRIRVRNQALQELVDEETIFYLDVNTYLEDGNGNLCADYSGDGVHLKGAYYSLWQTYLQNYAIVLPEWSDAETVEGDEIVMVKGQDGTYTAVQDASTVTE